MRASKVRCEDDAVLAVLAALEPLAKAVAEVNKDLDFASKMKDVATKAKEKSIADKEAANQLVITLTERKATLEAEQVVLSSTFRTLAMQVILCSDSTA